MPTITNAEIHSRLRTVNEALNQEAFSHTKIRFALTRNARILEDELEDYHSELQDLREDHPDLFEDHENRREELQQEFQELQEADEEEYDAARAAEIQEELQEFGAFPDEVADEVEELRQIEVEVEEYTVSDAYLDEEEDVPFEFLYQLDWMFE